MSSRPSFLDKPVSEMSISELQRLVRHEVSRSVPPIPPRIRDMADEDQPLILPDYAEDGDLLRYDAARGMWVVEGGDTYRHYTGTVILTAQVGLPEGGWLLCDGQAHAKSSFPDLWNQLHEDKGTCTISIASPGVVTRNAHGLADGAAVYFTTTGALPTGLSANTTYYVLNSAANTFQVSATRGGAAINTSGTQSGVHSLVFAPYGVTDANNFRVPELRDRVPVGQGVEIRFDALGEQGGELAHQLLTSEMPLHNHSGNTLVFTGNAMADHNHTQNAHGHQVSVGGAGTRLRSDGANPADTDGGGPRAGGSQPGFDAENVTATNNPASAGTPSGSISGNTGDKGNDGTHNNVQPYTVLKFIIKT